MRLCIVPMKPLADAKARLSEVLSPEERRALSLAMLEDVVRAGRALDAVWVLNSDADAAETAVRAGAEARPDPAPGQGLNASLMAATKEAIDAGARGVLVLSADCPAASQADVRALALGTGVVLGPNLDLTGTNALWRSPPDAIELHFGPRSRIAHQSIARGAGIPFAIVPRQGVALDVDRPRDLDAAWRAPSLGEATRAMLGKLGYPARSGR
jgi:2-phospho-L-lactate guanylyltransferase